MAEDEEVETWDLKLVLWSPTASFPLGFSEEVGFALPSVPELEP